jgi:hypothetical protein
MESGIALLDVSKLSVDIPAIWVDRPRARDIAGVRRHTCPVDSRRLKINRRRFVTGARWESTAGFTQVVVEILQSRSPARRNGKFRARAESPARAHSRNLVLVAGQARVSKEPRLRPGEPTGCVEKPMIEGITDPAAHCRNEVKLFGHSAKLSRSRRDDAVIEKIWERDISFNSDQQSRRKHIIVAELQSAKEAAE